MPKNAQAAVTTKIKSIYPAGVEHTYTTTPLGFDESGELALKIGAITARPLGDIFGSVMAHLSVADALEAAKAAEDGELTAKAKADARKKDILDGVDPGDILDRLVQGLIAAGGMELVAEVLNNTKRHTPAPNKDTKPLNLHLSDAMDRSKAYAGGNQGEAAKAVAWVIAVNYAPFLMDRSWSFGEGLQLLQELLGEARQGAEEAEKSEPS